MSGCTGSCNQGRNCTCFDASAPSFEFRAAHALLEVAAVLVAVSCGYFWSTWDVANGCEGQGNFRAWGAVYECSPRARP